MMSSIYNAFYQYHISKRLKDMTNNYMCKLCIYISKNLYEFCIRVYIYYILARASRPLLVSTFKIEGNKATTPTRGHGDDVAAIWRQCGGDRGIVAMSSPCRCHVIVVSSRCRRYVVVMSS